MFGKTPLKKIFYHYFFTDKSNIPEPDEICAVGWEPNPGMTQYLQQLQEAYHQCKYR